MTTIAIYSNKGGVGKTAAAVNLSYCAAQAGLKMLVCDLDPQGATTYYFRGQPKLKSGAIGLSKRGKALKKSVQPTDYANLELLPADLSHRHLDLAFQETKRPDQRLRKTLKTLAKRVDVMILDCPPTINLIAENIVNAADIVLVPLVPTRLAVRAYTQLRDFLRAEDLSPEKLYTFFSMVRMENDLHRERAIYVFRNFAGVLRTPIPFLPHLEHMDLHQAPMAAFAPESKAAQSYQQLWDEIAPLFVSAE